MSKAACFCSSFLIVAMRNEMQKSKWRGRGLRYAPLILWIGVIFFLSSTQGAMTQTSRFIRPLLEFLFPGASEETLIIYHGYIRKAAHFVEYAMLGFWAFYAFRNSSLRFLCNFWWLYAFILILFTASIDEYNQSFNSSRTGSVYEVLIDLSGGVVMFLLLCLSKRFFSKGADNKNL